MGITSTRIIRYQADLLGNIKQILAGLHDLQALCMELIQNADDAQAKEIDFDFRPDRLLIKNDGVFTNCGMRDDHCEGDPEGQKRVCDFHAISTVGSSNKSIDPTLIGRFGIGFVSVYQITDRPCIKSAGGQLTLNPQSARNEYSIIAHIEGTEIDLPWAFKNSPTRQALEFSPLRKGAVPEILSAFEELINRSLYFLRHLEKVSLLRNGKPTTVVRIERPTETQLLLRKNNNLTEKWYVIQGDASGAVRELLHRSKVLSNSSREKEFSIAFRLEPEPLEKGLIYAFLPTRWVHGLPCHVNADFFPSQDRKSILLDGQQDKQTWNICLLEAVASELSKQLIEAREELGFELVWTTIAGAFSNWKDNHLGIFWERIEEDLVGKSIVWTAENEWAIPEDVRMPPKGMDNKEEKVASLIGLPLVHESIRQYQQSLFRLGIRQLSLDDVAEAGAAWPLSPDEHTFEKLLRPFWRLVEHVEDSSTAGSEEAWKRLDKLELVFNSACDLTCVNNLYALPSSLKPIDILRFIPNLPLVDARYKQFRTLYSRIDELTFPALLGEIEALIQSEEDAFNLLGTESIHLKFFYRFLSNYAKSYQEEELDESDVLNQLKRLPLYRTKDGFIRGETAVLPGGFDDPIGSLRMLDTTVLDQATREFFEKGLAIQILDIHTYIQEYLPTLIEDGVTNEQNKKLLSELCKHREVVDDEETSQALSNMPIVPTKRGYKSPLEAYFRTTELAALLGKTFDGWVTEEKLPKGKKKSLKLLLHSLGMPEKAQLPHLVNRHETVCGKRPTKGRVLNVRDILLFLSREWTQTDNPEDMNLEPLTEMSWLPARDDDQDWYEPGELYQPFRADGFSSQVGVLAIRSPELRGEFLAALGIEPEPSTEIIVDHLLHCMEQEQTPSLTVYQILNERFKRDDEVDEIDRLQDEAFVYFNEQKRYVKATQVFWNTPEFGQRAFRASEWMRHMRDVFEYLGVREEPDLDSYVEILKDLSEEHGVDYCLEAEDVSVYHKCVNQISEVLTADPDQKEIVMKALGKVPCLLTRAGSLGFIDEVVLQDREWLAEQFDEDFRVRVVEDRPEFRPFYRALGVMALSAVTRIEKVETQELRADEEAAQRIHERAELIVRVCASHLEQSQSELLDTLTSLKIIRCSVLKIRSHFEMYKTPISSGKHSVDSFFEQETGILYAVVDSAKSQWAMFLRGILLAKLAGLEGDEFGKNLLVAQMVCEAPTRDEAEEKLKEVGFSFYSTLDMGELESPILDAPPDASFSQGVPMPETEIEDDVQEDETEASPESSSTDSARESGGEVEREHENDDEYESSTEKKRSTSRTNLRTEYMRSYVMPKPRSIERSRDAAEVERISEIDRAAIEAVCEFEEREGREVKRLPHNNPGYDLISYDAEEERKIEVKGLSGPWTERGVKLTETQMNTARQFEYEYWLYVVEYATDPERQTVYLIQDLYTKVAEFWFDENWKRVAEQDIDFCTGQKVRISGGRVGTIMKILQEGSGIELVIDCEAGGGVKLVPIQNVESVD